MATKEKLLEFLRQRQTGGIALAFSGGTDSTLLLALLRELQNEAPFPWTALTMHSIFQNEEELNGVKDTTRQWAVPLNILYLEPLSIAQVRSNPPDRCYWCKRYIFTSFCEYAASQGLQTVMDGTNTDDLKVYRPGLQALRELNIVSPLAELGIDKKTVRALAHDLQLPCANKPAAPCLATRIEYGTPLTPDIIRQTQAGEAMLRRLCSGGADVRLRRHGDLARIEVPPAMISAIANHHRDVVAALITLGFNYVTLDLEGFRSGSMDINLKQKNTEV